MIYLYAFLLGGLLCGIAELIKGFFKITTGHITVIYVFFGTLLNFFNIYEFLITSCGAGALLPITNFGYLLAKGSYDGMLKDGFIGIFSGLYSLTSGGISYTILISFILSFIFKAKK